MASDTRPEGLFDLTMAVPMFHPNLAKARPFMRNGKPQGEPKFSANLAFDTDSADLRDIKTLCAKLARAKWPGRDLTSLVKPWEDGNKIADKAKANAEGKDKGEFNRGKIIITARSLFQPNLAIIQNGRVIDLDTPELLAAHIGKFYFGAEVLAQLNFNVHDEIGNNPAGINCYLNIVTATGKGKRIGGRPSASEVFAGYVGHVSNEDPTAGSAEATW